MVGLMEALKRPVVGVATGYFGTRVKQMAAIAKDTADKRKFKDELNAKEASTIRIQNNELSEKAKLKALEDEKKRKRRYDNLINLGFQPDFITMHGEYALGSDANFKNFLQLGQDTYGIARWWDTPIIFDEGGGYKGINVQEYLMSSGVTFDGNEVKNKTKDRTNIPNAIADSQMQIDETSATTTKPKLYGKDLFFAKATRARSEGNQYISLDGSQIITGFQYEQNLGKGDFGYTPTFTTRIVENEDGTREAQLFTFNPNEFVELDSTNGQTIFKDTRPFNDSITPTSYTVWDNKTEKTYTINGYRAIKTNGEIEEVLTGIDPTLANSWGIDLLTTEFFLPPIAKEIQTFNSFNIELDKFKAIMQKERPGLSINEKTGAGTGEIAANLLRYQVPKALSTSAENDIKSQATILAGFVAGKDRDFIEQGTLDRGLILSFFGDSQSSKTANAFGSIVDSSLGFIDNQYTAYEQSRGTKGLLNQDMGIYSRIAEGVTLADELGLSSSDPKKVGRDVFVNKVAEYYKTVRETLTENEEDNIKKLLADKTADKKVTLQDGTEVFEYDEYLKSQRIDDTKFSAKDKEAGIASVIVDRMLETNITTLDALLRVGVGIKEDVKIRKTTAESKRDIADSRAVNKYFPPSEAAMGADFESFVDNYIIDPDNEKQQLDLINAVKNLTDDAQERESLLNRANQYIETGRKEKYPFSKEETPFRVRKMEREEVDKAEREVVKSELGLDNVPKIDNKSDYSEIIKSTGYTKPTKKVGARVGRVVDKLEPINNLIEELNSLEIMGDKVIIGKFKLDKEKVLIERKDRIIRLKEEIERRLINLKRSS